MTKNDCDKCSVAGYGEVWAPVCCLHDHWGEGGIRWFERDDRAQDDSAPTWCPGMVRIEWTNDP